MRGPSKVDQYYNLSISSKLIVLSAAFFPCVYEWRLLAYVSSVLIYFLNFYLLNLKVEIVKSLL